MCTVLLKWTVVSWPQPVAVLQDSERVLTDRLVFQRKPPSGLLHKCPGPAQLRERVLQGHTAKEKRQKNTGQRLDCPCLGLTVGTRACRPACGQAGGWRFAQCLHAWVLTLGFTRSQPGQPVRGCACVHACSGYSISLGIRVHACPGEADYLWGCI